MDGREKRTQRIVERIKETALQQFSIQGVDMVSMDEIAAAAHVSKVTIYKYFHSKEELQKEVINLYIDRVFAATEALLNSSLDFMEKLKITLTFKNSKMALSSNRYFLDLLQRDQQAEGRLKQYIKNIIFRFVEEGKRQGYIEESISPEIFYLHSEIYRAGYEARINEVESIITGPEDHEKLIELYFWGIIKRKDKQEC